MVRVHFLVAEDTETLFEDLKEDVKLACAQRRPRPSLVKDRDYFIDEARTPLEAQSKRPKLLQKDLPLVLLFDVHFRGNVVEDFVAQIKSLVAATRCDRAENCGDCHHRRTLHRYPKVTDTRKE